MPSLATLFSRKSKSSSGHDSSNKLSSSPSSSYISPDKSLPSSPNGNATPNPYPSNKLRLPFTRKKHPAAASSTSIATTSHPHDYGPPSPPRPPYLARTSNASVSDSDTSIIENRRLRPPPSKSAIFAAYAVPQHASLVLSTRSLPDPHLPETPPPPLPLSFPQQQKDDGKHAKKPSFFNWASGSKSTPITPSETSHNPTKSVPHYVKNSPTEDKSFNLRAFRHVAGAINASDVSVNQPAGVPRPRGASATSESSQRISVAAFREAQARRSTAGSPVPSLRAPSPGVGGPYGSSSPSSPNFGSKSQSNQNLAAKRRSSNLAFTSESDDESAEEEDESDDDASVHKHTNTKTPHSTNGESIHRQRTVTKRIDPGNDDSDRTRFRATKSESGHGTFASTSRSASNSAQSHPYFSKNHSFAPLPPVSTSGSGSTTDIRSTPSRSQSSLGFKLDPGRQRASASVSAAMPSAAARRASAVVASGNDFKRHVRDASMYSNQDGKGSEGLASDFRRSHFRESSTYSSSKNSNPQHASSHKATLSAATSTSTSASDSEDDTPLATLMQPRRPGSALSHSSNARSTTSTSVPRHKPLIDINELTGANNNTGRKPKPNDVAFTGAGTLIASSSASKSILGKGGVLTSSPTHTSSSPPLVSMSPPTKFLSPPASPEKELPGFMFGQKGSSGGEGGNVPISERLSRIVLSTVGVGGGGVSSSSSGSGLGLGSYEFPSPPTHPNEITPPRKSLSGSSLPRLHVPGDSSSSFGVGGSSDVGKLSPPDQVLAEMLGGGISLISRAGESESDVDVRGRGGRDDSDSDSESESESDYARGKVGVGGKGKDTMAKGKGKGKEQEKADPKRAPTKLRKKSPVGKVNWRSTSLSLSLSPTTSQPQSPVSDPDLEQVKEEDRIAPIPIKQRAPTPSFSVTSRPVRTSTVMTTTTTTTMVTNKVGVDVGTRQRSTTMLPSPTSSSSGARPGILASSANLNTNSKGDGSGSPGARQRSSTMLSGTVPISKSSTSGSASGLNTVPFNKGPTSKPPGPNTKAPSVKPTASSFKTALPPPKPFANVHKRESPASSTGDSSSERAPFTPRDGSDVGSGSLSGSAGGVVRSAGEGRRIKRRSVSFEEDLPGGSGGVKGRETPVDRGRNRDVDVEERRKERRRSEAKAAIELGNIINGRGPIVDDDDDEDDIPINQTMGGSRTSAINPMMAMGGPTPMQMQMPFGGPTPWNNMNPNMMNMNAWQQQQQNPQMPFVGPGADPSFFVAHQQAMMYAKQAYQMAVAQQAMAAAGDEWERGSSIGSGFGGGSVFGGGGPSVMRPPPFGMMGMGMGGMGNGWSNGSVIFPPSSRSMYDGFSGARSEYGGGGGGGGGRGGWSSSRSSYGELGPSKARGGGQRNSGVYPPVPPVPRGGGGSSNVARGTPRSRTTSQPASVGRGVRKAPPPSSWKAGV